VVPDRNRSGASHSITFGAALALRQVEDQMWTCAGTPVDCVLSVLVHGGISFDADVVVSGINAGENLGTDLLYSGTAGAARQASVMGFPAVAFSLHGNEPYHWETAAAWSAQNLDLLLGQWKPNIFVNVNYPNIPRLTDWTLTYPSFRIYEDLIHIDRSERPGPEELSASLHGGNVSPKALSPEERSSGVHPRMPSDWDAVLSGRVSVSRVYNHPVVAEG
jgi:5'-nucleotidase